MNRQDRSALAKFCCGTAPIMIELGRYSNTRVDDRQCILCNAHEIEDECHVLIECLLYEDISEELFVTYAVPCSQLLGN